MTKMFTWVIYVFLLNKNLNKFKYIVIHFLVYAIHGDLSLAHFLYNIHYYIPFISLLYKVSI